MIDLSPIFKAYDIRGRVGTELTPEVTKVIGRAFAKWLPESGTVAVGRDMRPDSKELADGVIRGLRAQGRDVWDIGEVTSDMIYFAVGDNAPTTSLSSAALMSTNPATSPSLLL